MKNSDSIAEEMLNLPIWK